MRLNERCRKKDLAGDGSVYVCVCVLKIQRLSAAREIERTRVWVRERERDNVLEREGVRGEDRR